MSWKVSISRFTDILRTISNAQFSVNNLLKFSVLIILCLRFTEVVCNRFGDTICSARLKYSSGRFVKLGLNDFVDNFVITTSLRNFLAYSFVISFG